MHETYPDMSIGDWNDAIDQFMQTYEGIRKWHVQSEYLMKDSGVARDIFGRKRRISKKEIRLNFKHCLNQFVNFPVQSSACALIELSLVKLRERLSGEWMRGVKPINFVHDEIVLEVEDSLLDEVKPHVIDCLENTVQLRVPVRADMNVVQSWGDAK
jgi:DNA polymerase-1